MIKMSTTTELDFVVEPDKTQLVQSHFSIKDYLQPKRVLFGILVIVFLVLVISVSIYFGSKDDDSDTSNSCPKLFSASTMQSTRDKCNFPHYDIVQDNLDIHKMISMAKKGDFNTVWPILKDKPYLINVIPEGKSYALLHHAARLNDMKAVSILVNNSACDVLVKSIPNWTDKTMGGKIALNLTSNEMIKRLLRKFTDQKLELRFKTPSIFFATKSRGEKYNTYGLPVFLISLSAYKNTFIRNRTITPSMHFQNILKLVYRSSDYAFVDVEKKITTAMYGFDAKAAQGLQSETKPDFYSNIIKLYTSNSVYGDVNLLMKRQAFYNYTTYRPRGSTLSLGPYALMLDSVLTFWDKLKPFNNVTYRGIPTNVSSHHHVGMQFVYLDFVSSTDDIHVANKFAKYTGSVFVINNKQQSPWQPRDIAKYSDFPHEREYLYPPGAEFNVTGMKNRFIYLDLKNPKYV